MTDWRCGERLGKDFEGNKNIFCSEEKPVRKCEQARSEMVKHVNGQILRDGVEMRRRESQGWIQPWINSVPDPAPGLDILNRY